MKIYITSSIGIGETLRIDDIDSPIKIEDLKQHICEKYNEYKLERIGLLFYGEFLDNDDKLSDFDIKSGSILNLIDVTRTTRNLNNFGLKFVDVTASDSLKCIQWSQTAPPWRRARQGLCLEGRCTNRKCNASDKKVIMSMGYTKFDLLSDSNANTTKCPVCKEYVSPTTCAFNNCWWRYEGLKDNKNKPPESCSNAWTWADDAYRRFDEETGENISWRRLILEAVRQLPSEQRNPKEVSNVPEEKISVQVSEASAGNLFL